MIVLSCFILPPLFPLKAFKLSITAKQRLFLLRMSRTLSVTTELVMSASLLFWS